MAGRREIAGRIGGPSTEDPVRRAVRVGLVAILLLRWMVPTEGTLLGGTLWLAQLSLLLGVVWSWSLLRGGASERCGRRIRFGRFDGAVAVLVGLHVVSVIAVVVRGDGNTRAAINVGWEWVSVFVTYVVARNVIDTRRHAARLLHVLVGVTIAVAGLGVWQYAVAIPQLRETYESERAELDRLIAIPDVARTRDESQRLAEIRLSFESQGVPLEGSGRTAFESRLLGSREPLGRFALANTFAGWLLVGAFALVGLVLRSREDGNALRTVLLGIGLAVVLYCLLLTKSRTAWVGGIVAGFGWALSTRLALRERLPGWTWRVGIGAAVLVASGVVVALATGGLDREVLSQAPRSLRFRLQYWAGTAGMIADHPVLGVGPGNFRAEYERHKLPAASEEILDPHNLVFDVWANAGSLAPIALAVAILFSVRDRRADSTTQSPESTESPKPESVDAGRTEMTIGIALAALVLLARAGLSGETDWESLVVLTVTGLVTLGFSNGSPRAGVGIGWGAIALLVHLLGAGGIGMPAVQLVLLAAYVIVRVITLQDPEAEPPGFAIGGRAATLIGLGIGVMFVGQLTTATLPVIESDLLDRSARTAIIDGQPGRARELFERAAERDPRSPDHAETAGRFAFEVWRGSGERDETAFRRAVRFQTEAIRRDPRSAARLATLADHHESRFRAVGDVSDGERAAELLAGALDRYPTNPALRSRRAILLADLGRLDESKTEAAEAARLDEINRAEGHVDRWLPDDVRNRVESILADEPMGS